MVSTDGSSTAASPPAGTRACVQTNTVEAGSSVSISRVADVRGATMGQVRGPIAVEREESDSCSLQREGPIRSQPDQPAVNVGSPPSVQLTRWRQAGDAALQLEGPRASAPVQDGGRQDLDSIRIGSVQISLHSRTEADLVGFGANGRIGSGRYRSIWRMQTSRRWAGKLSWSACPAGRTHCQYRQMARSYKRGSGPH